jgi:hypothetical protein
MVNRIGAATHKDHFLPPFWTPFSLFIAKKSTGEISAAGDGVLSGQGGPKNLPFRSVRKLLPRIRL